MKPNIIVTADTHLRNDDSYGEYDSKGINDFLILRYKCFLRAVNKAIKLQSHFVVAGDFLDSRIVDPHTLYYSSLLVKKMQEIPFVVLLEGNHGYSEKNSDISVIAHWKHLVNDNVRIITYPKIERSSGIAYHCIPAISDIDSNFGRVIKDFRKGIKKSDANILILHAPIIGAAFDSGKKSIQGIPIEQIERASRIYDYIVCGDLHRHQFLFDKVWYCGSIMQSNLRDKGQTKGYQLIDLDSGDIKFIDSNGPRFLELSFKPGKSISKVLKHPHKYKHLLNNSVVIVRIAVSKKYKDISSYDFFRKVLKDSGAFRVFFDFKALTEKTQRIKIESTMSDNDMLQSYCEYKKEHLPSSENETLKCGLVYMSRA